MPLPNDLAPDVAVAIELIERIGIADWSRLTEGLSHSSPYVLEPDSERFDDVQAWLATRAGDQESFVQAAVANFGRVLDDLLLVLHYEMDVRERSYWVSKWYHVANGGTGSRGEVEFYEIHVLLIRNLVAEMTRAINLVLARAREADSRVATAVGLAIVDTGSDHAPMQPARYSDTERRLPQPYPGLLMFPGVIESRDIGTLGQTGEGVPRTIDDFGCWITELLKRRPAKPSGPPPEGEPPFSLPRPTNAPARIAPSETSVHAGKQLTTVDRLQVLREVRLAASAATETESMYAANEMVTTYVRLREKARELHLSAGLDAETFDRDVPVWRQSPSAPRNRADAFTGAAGLRAMLDNSSSARHLLKQLETWASSNIRAVELELAREKQSEAGATAAAVAEAIAHGDVRIAEAIAEGDARVADANARAEAAEARAIQLEARVADAESEALQATGALQALQERRARFRRAAFPVVLILAGVAIAVVLPFWVVHGGVAVSAAVIGGVALGLYGTRLLIGAKLGGELVLWAALIVAMIAVAVSIISSNKPAPSATPASTRTTSHGP